MAKEKTKAEILQELNEQLNSKIRELQARNDGLIAEIRQAKSSVSRAEANSYKLDEYDKLDNEKRKTELDLENANRQLSIQDKQIEILINGLNALNNDITKLFDNVDYVLSLAKVNYDKNFNTIQNNLNNLITRKGEIENGNANNN